MTIILSNINRFKNFFTGKFLDKFAVQRILKTPLFLVLAYVATLPCKTLMSAKHAINDKLHFLRLLAVCRPGPKVHETITFLLVTLPNIHRFKKKFTHGLSSKPVLILLLTTPPRFKCVPTLLYNLSLMACFAGINVSQGSVATYARYGGIIDIHLTANLQRNLPVKKLLNMLRFDGIMVMSLWPRFLAHPVVVTLTNEHVV